MKSKYTVHYAFLIVLLAHAATLGAIIYAPEKPAPIFIEPPTIQGVIVASEPIKPPEPTPPPPPEQKPLPTPKIPVPKAPPSERAPQVEQQSPPQETVEQPVKQAEPTPAPVSLPQADANHLNNPAPVYPAQSKRLNETGTVILEVLVLADGSAGDVRLKTSSGFKRLDEAAVRAVKNWHFVPAKRGGEAIDFTYDLPVEFTLNH